MKEKLQDITLNDMIDNLEDFQDLVLETNAERVREDWDMLGLPRWVCDNNPYQLLYKASEGVRLGLLVTSFVNGLRYPE